ncbi:OprO/OprP family phosphate-selective porin [Pseudomarimonas arenosa]|uniref:Porin n=1 Tax=Pseudomarimonas arenosa TaxID=2774145 RepID=A0AAW3ZQT4_9GAMM|nr:OprO/OprP family phosphate-selective porin [Pseudomarimonas arenosa]MBD8526942.1 porin [Pseudomarimonas arenosa]
MSLGTRVAGGCVVALLSAPASAEIELDAFGSTLISFEGLIQADYNKFDSDRANLNGDALDGDDSDAELRRAELVLKGATADWNWVVGYDAKADKFLDVNFRYKFSSQNSLMVGQYKQPNSLEELTSTKNNDFISKSMTTNLFAVARRLGVSGTSSGELWTASASLFGKELTHRLARGDGFGIRGTYTPIQDFESQFLHLGLSYVQYDAEDATADNRARIRVRPDADLAGVRLIDSGQFSDADDIRTVGAELAWANGPFKLQGEYMQSRVRRTANPDYDVDSAYLQGVWNISGEGWGYKEGVVRTNAPNDPAKGMWQVGLRYDIADLDDGSVFGGDEQNLTVGVNYYWHANFKFALNYVDVSSERGSTPIQDDPSILEFRAQFYW